MSEFKTHITTPGPLLEEKAAFDLAQSRKLAVLVLPLFDDRGRRRLQESFVKQGWRMGYIELGPVNGPSIEGRPSKQARMVKIHSAHADLYFGTLYDPVISFMSEEGFTLRGYNMRDIGYGNTLTMQVWLVKKCPG